LGKYLLIARMGRLQWRISFLVVWDDDLEPVQKSRALGLYPFGRWIHFAHTLFIFNSQHHSSVCGIGKSERYYECPLNESWMDRTVSTFWTCSL
jgi:hypothetical protein